MWISKTKPRWAYLPECRTPPTEWSVVPLTEIATVIPGQSPPSESYNKRKEGLPFLQGNGDFSDKNPVPSVWCTSPKKAAAKGDTLFSVRAPVGEVNRADRIYAIGRGLAAIRAKNCDGDFLYHALQHWRQSLQRVGQGTTFDAITARHFTDLLVTLPSDHSEQAAIAHILDSVDAALQRTREAAERARDYKLALAQKVLSEGLQGEILWNSPIGRIPRSWQVVPLKCVVESFQYGLSVPMDDRGPLPILRMGNIQNDDVELSDLKFVNLPEETVKPYLLSRGDVLFNRTNSQELVGKVGVFRHEKPAVFASYLIRVSPMKAKVDSVYLGHILGTYSVQCRIKRFATPGVQQVNINATNLGRVLVPLPSGENGLEEQRHIGMLLEAAHNVVKSYGPIMSALQILKKSLMHDLLTGKVRIGDLAEWAVP